MSDTEQNAETYVPGDSFRERSPSTDRSVIIMDSPVKETIVNNNDNKESQRDPSTNSNSNNERRYNSRYERRDSGYSSYRNDHRGYSSRDTFRKVRIQEPYELRYPEGAEINKDLVYCITRNVHKLDITLSKMGLLEYVDIPSIVKACIMKPADADKIIDEFDQKCKSTVSNPSSFLMSLSSKLLRSQKGDIVSEESKPTQTSDQMEGTTKPEQIHQQNATEGTAQPIQNDGLNRRDVPSQLYNNRRDNGFGRRERYTERRDNSMEIRDFGRMRNRSHERRSRSRSLDGRMRDRSLYKRDSSLERRDYGRRMRRDSLERRDYEGMRRRSFDRRDSSLERRDYEGMRRRSLDRRDSSLERRDYDSRMRDRSPERRDRGFGRRDFDRRMTDRYEISFSRRDYDPERRRDFRRSMERSY